MEANPGLIVVRISGHGQTGPLRDQPGFGTIAEAAGGLRYLTGEPDRPPARVGLSLGDSIASLHALVGALIALHERQASGRGQVVDVALTEAVFSLLEGRPARVQPLRHGARAGRQHRPQLGARPTPIPVPTAISCASRPTPRRCSAACSGRSAGTTTRTTPAPVGNQGASAAPGELDDAIGSWTATRTADEVVAILRGRRIPVSRINSIADIVADPQFQGRDMIVAVMDDRLPKPLLVPGVVPKLSRTPGRVPPLARPLGEDTAAVRASSVGASARPWSETQRARVRRRRDRDR